MTDTATIDRPTASPPSASISTEFRLLKGAVPASGGLVPGVLRIRADLPTDERTRTAIDLALVLDRSGSMNGEPIHAAKAAAHDAIDLLEEGDRVALVTFDSEIEVVIPPTSVSDRAPLHRAIEGIYPRGMTALHAGWLEGSQQLVDLLDDDRSARVLLLTDGQANRGIVDPRQIAADVARLKEVGIATSTVGLGRRFQEDLLTTMANAGGGRFAFAESPTALEGLMAAEIMALDAIVGREVTARLQTSGERATAIEAIGEYPRLGDTLKLPDLLIGMPYELPVEIQVAAGEPASDVTLGSIEARWTDPAGKTVDVTVPIVADALDDAAYDAAPEDVDVVVAHVVAVAGSLYDDAMQALDRHDRPGMEASLGKLERRLQAAPDDDRITRQRERLNAARDSVRMRDNVMARKRLHHGRERSFSRFEHEAFSASDFASEKQASLAHRKAMRAEPSMDGPPRMNRATVYELRRPDGTRARLQVLRGDITTVRADALVNPSNTHLHGSGPSVDGAVHRVGGMELTRECRQIGRIELTQAVATKGHRLPVDYVVHVAVPAFRGDDDDFDQLDKTYLSALDMARQLRIRHLTVPAIGTGTNGFPLPQATARAVALLVDELEAGTGLDRIDVVLFGSREMRTYLRAIDADGRLRP